MGAGTDLHEYGHVILHWQQYKTTVQCGAGWPGFEGVWKQLAQGLFGGGLQKLKVPCSGAQYKDSPQCHLTSPHLTSNPC